ncbi:class I SAM-dependent methyltransferase [Dactylosporangium sp. CA-233914]|uniref:class I SAM-dependent methyltransferase n=1 Tax=Dactylosporangium sp. CA-233914 TaxID=3239934 RepID=UPI003D8DC03F
MDAHGHHHHHHHHHGPEHNDGLAELLELDAEVLHTYHAGIAGWVRSEGPESAKVIVDLGAGTGAGTLLLLEQFPGAHVVAVDADPAMLQRLAANAAARGAGERVTTVHADLDTAWPTGLQAADVVWAANSMHHMADPQRVLRDILAALSPGGVLALAELDTFPRFLPDELGVGRPGLESRAHEAMARRREVDMPFMYADWSLALAKAGFEVRAERRFEVTLPAPLPPAGVRYARTSLRRIRDGLAESLDPDDVAALDALLDEHGPQSLTRRDDLTVRAARTVWIAARP